MGARYFRTHNGREVYPLTPRPEHFNIEDIARSLSQQCRFLGHTDSFYSIAQHSVLVSQHVPAEDALWGLLHDAAEAYIGDLPAPIKRDPAMEFYCQIEGRLLRQIAHRFRLTPLIMPASVSRADKIVLATEFRDVTTMNDPDWIVTECGFEPLRDFTIVPWPPLVAEDCFLRRYAELAK